MKIDFLFVAEAAHRESSGVLHAFSIFDSVNVPNFPHVHSTMAVVGRFRISRVDIGTHAVRTVIVDADGKTLIEQAIELAVTQMDRDSTSIPFTLTIANLTIAEAGDYAVEVFIDGRQEISTPISFQQQQAT